MMEKEASKYYIHMFYMQSPEEKEVKEEVPYNTENFEMVIVFVNYIKKPGMKKDNKLREATRSY